MGTVAVPSPPVGGLSDPLMPKKAVLRDLGDLSTMTFWRLQHHEDLVRRFPPPDVRLGRKGLWHQSTVERYVEAQKRLSHATPRPRVGTRSRPDNTVAGPPARAAAPE